MMDEYQFLTETREFLTLLQGAMAFHSEVTHFHVHAHMYSHSTQNMHLV